METSDIVPSSSTSLPSYKTMLSSLFTIRSSEPQGIASTPMLGGVSLSSSLVKPFAVTSVAQRAASMTSETRSVSPSSSAKPANFNLQISPGGSVCVTPKSTTVTSAGDSGQGVMSGKPFRFVKPTADGEPQMFMRFDNQPRMVYRLQPSQGHQLNLKVNSPEKQSAARSGAAPTTLTMFQSMKGASLPVREVLHVSHSEKGPAVAKVHSKVLMVPDQSASLLKGQEMRSLLKSSDTTDKPALSKASTKRTKRLSGVKNYALGLLPLDTLLKAEAGPHRKEFAIIRRRKHTARKSFSQHKSLNHAAFIKAALCLNFSVQHCDASDGSETTTSSEAITSMADQESSFEDVSDLPFKIDSVFSLANCEEQQLVDFSWEDQPGSSEKNPIEVEEFRQTHTSTQEELLDMCGSTFVVLERMDKSVILENGNHPIKSRCSDHCRNRTLNCLCRLDLIRCHEKKKRKFEMDENSDSCSRETKIPKTEPTPAAEQVSDNTVSNTTQPDLSGNPQGDGEKAYPPPSDDSMCTEVNSLQSAFIAYHGADETTDRAVIHDFFPAVCSTVMPSVTSSGGLSLDSTAVEEPSLSSVSSLANSSLATVTDTTSVPSVISCQLSAESTLNLVRSESAANFKETQTESDSEHERMTVEEELVNSGEDTVSDGKRQYIQNYFVSEKGDMDKQEAIKEGPPADGELSLSFDSATTIHASKGTNRVAQSPIPVVYLNQPNPDVGSSLSPSLSSEAVPLASTHSSAVPVTTSAGKTSNTRSGPVVSQPVKIFLKLASTPQSSSAQSSSPAVYSVARTERDPVMSTSSVQASCTSSTTVSASTACKTIKVVHKLAPSSDVAAVTPVASCAGAGGSSGSGKWTPVPPVVQTLASVAQLVLTPPVAGKVTIPILSAVQTQASVAQLVLTPPVTGKVTTPILSAVQTQASVPQSVLTPPVAGKVTTPILSSVQTQASVAQSVLTPPVAGKVMTPILSAVQTQASVAQLVLTPPVTAKVTTPILSASASKLMPPPPVTPGIRWLTCFPNSSTRQGSGPLYLVVNTAGKNQSYTSVPLSSAPLSSAPLSSAPLSSAPLSSAPLSSAPLSSASSVVSSAQPAPLLITSQPLNSNRQTCYSLLKPATQLATPPTVASTGTAPLKPGNKIASALATSRHQGPAQMMIRSAKGTPPWHQGPAQMMIRSAKGTPPTHSPETFVVDTSTSGSLSSLLKQVTVKAPGNEVRARSGKPTPSLPVSDQGPNTNIQVINVPDRKLNANIKVINAPDQRSITNVKVINAHNQNPNTNIKVINMLDKRQNTNIKVVNSPDQKTCPDIKVINVPNATKVPQVQIVNSLVKTMNPTIMTLKSKDTTSSTNLTGTSVLQQTYSTASKSTRVVPVSAPQQISVACNPLSKSIRLVQVSTPQQTFVPISSCTRVVPVSREKRVPVKSAFPSFTTSLLRTPLAPQSSPSCRSSPSARQQSTPVVITVPDSPPSHARPPVQPGCASTPCSSQSSPKKDANVMGNSRSTSVTAGLEPTSVSILIPSSELPSATGDKCAHVSESEPRNSKTQTPTSYEPSSFKGPFTVPSQDSVVTTNSASSSVMSVVDVESKIPLTASTSDQKRITVENKRAYLAKKYPLPPGVVIKSEPMTFGHPTERTDDTDEDGPVSSNTVPAVWPDVSAAATHSDRGLCSPSVAESDLVADVPLDYESADPPISFLLAESDSADAPTDLDCPDLETPACGADGPQYDEPHVLTPVVSLSAQPNETTTSASSSRTKASAYSVGKSMSARERKKRSRAGRRKTSSSTLEHAGSSDAVSCEEEDQEPTPASSRSPTADSPVWPSLISSLASLYSSQTRWQSSLSEARPASSGSSSTDRVRELKEKLKQQTAELEQIRQQRANQAPLVFIDND